MALYHIEGAYPISEGRKPDLIRRKSAGMWPLALNCFLWVSAACITSFRSAPSMNADAWMGTHRCSLTPTLTPILSGFVSLDIHYQYIDQKIIDNITSCVVIPAGFWRLASARVSWYIEGISQNPRSWHRPWGLSFPMGFLSKTAEMRISLVVHRCDSLWPLSFKQLECSPTWTDTCQ